MDLRLQDKNVVVTGAARGIGLAIARVFSEEGAKVLMVDRDPEVAAKAAELAGAAHLACDLREPACMDEIAARLEEMGGCSVIVNNAGISIMASIADATDADWDEVMAVNLQAAFRLTRQLWSQLAARRGCVVNVASFAAKRATLFGGNVSYTVSKHGIAGLTRAAAMDGARDGIRVNAVAPGVVDTDLVKLHDEATRKKIQGMIPLGRYADAGEIADAAAYLASERAAHITGEVLNVNGGMLMD